MMKWTVTWRFLVSLALASALGTPAGASSGQHPLFGIKSADPSACARHFWKEWKEVETDDGPKVYLKSLNPNPYPLEDFHRMTVLQYNAENIMTTTGKFWTDPETGRVHRVLPAIQKEPDRRERMKEIMLRSNAHYMSLQEIESLAALTVLAKDDLLGRYNPALILGNDQRSINIGQLVDSRLPFQLEIQSHRNHTHHHNDQILPLYSRDVVATLFRRTDASPMSPPEFIIIKIHKKSQRDGHRDRKSIRKRTAQYEGLAGIVRKYEKMYPNVPIVVTGDFNCDIRYAQELAPLWKIGMKDAFDVAPKTLPPEQRVTQTYHELSRYTGEEMPAVLSQLDGFVLNRAAQRIGLISEITILRYREDDGSEMPIALSYAARKRQGSDHSPVLAVFDLTRLRSNSLLKRAP